MPEQKRHKNQASKQQPTMPLSFFACPNSECAVSTALMRAIYRWLNRWEKTKQFAGCIAKPVAQVSANAKAHLCRIPNYPKPKAADDIWLLCTPAIAAGLTDYVWPLKEWLKLPTVQPW